MVFQNQAKISVGSLFAKEDLSLPVHHGSSPEPTLTNKVAQPAGQQQRCFANGGLSPNLCGTSNPNILIRSMMLVLRQLRRTSGSLKSRGRSPTKVRDRERRGWTGRVGNWVQRGGGASHQLAAAPGHWQPPQLSCGGDFLCRASLGQGKIRF